MKTHNFILKATIVLSIFIMNVSLAIGQCSMKKNTCCMNANMSSENKMSNDSIQKDSVIYTCSMHPEIQSNKPGSCPKCGMALVKQSKSSGKQEKKHDMKMCPMMKMDMDTNKTKGKK